MLEGQGVPEEQPTREAAPDTAAPPAPRAQPRTQPCSQPGAYRDPVVWATALATAGAYCVISLSRLLQLNPSSWDLGIYTEYVKQYAYFRAPVVDIRAPGFNLLGDHFTPILAVLGPFFRIFPSAATLLVAQALLATVSVFPIAQLAREKLGLGSSRAVAVAYGFSWGLQQLADFDFHEIAFAVPLLAFSLSALARGRVRATVCWALPLVFVKEDQGFTVAAIGIYLVLSSLRGTLNVRRAAAGQFLLIWGFAWSFLAIGVIIPHFNPAHHYDYWSDGGVFSPGAHLSLAGLVSQLGHAWPAKLETVAMLLLPTAFLALRSPLALIAVPSLLLRFVSTDSAFWGTYWHYNATVMPIIFVAAVDGLARIGAGGDQLPDLRGKVLGAVRRYAAALMVVIAVPVAFQFPLSDLWHAQTYQVSPHVAADQAAMARVPDGASVLTTLGLLAPLAARADTYWIGNSGNPQTQYIVFDGPNSGYSPAIKDVPAFIAGLYPPHTYTEIFAADGVYVFRHSAFHHGG